MAVPFFGQNELDQYFYTDHMLYIWEKDVLIQVIAANDFFSILYHHSLEFEKSYRLIYKLSWRSLYLVEDDLSLFSIIMVSLLIYDRKVYIRLCAGKSHRIDWISIVKYFYHLMWVFGKKKLRFLQGAVFGSKRPPSFEI